MKYRNPELGSKEKKKATCSITSTARHPSLDTLSTEAEIKVVTWSNLLSSTGVSMRSHSSISLCPRPSS